MNLRELWRRPFAPVADVRPEETREVALLLVNVFVLLVAWYVLKTVREPLILLHGGAELKAYASAAQAGLLVVLVPLYGLLASRVSRARLVVGLNVLFAASIEVFAALAGGDHPWLGFAFYVWTGIFNVSVVAQFWSYANDRYDREDGERVFPAVALGATLGAPVGSAAAGALFDAGVEARALMHLAVGLLAVSLGLYVLLERQARASGGAVHEPVPSASGFRLVLYGPYLRGIALFLVALNVVNTTGEYVLAAYVEDAAAASDDAEAWIGAFYGGFYSTVNVAAVALQALVVSRIVRTFGIGGLLFALPVVSLSTWSLVAGGAGLGVLRWFKAAENATDYSITNTGRAMLWLPTSRAEKYQAKQAVDTFFVRVGDMLSAGIVFAGTTWFGLDPAGFARVNLAVIALWFGLAVVLWRGFRRRAAEGVG